MELFTKCELLHEPSHETGQLNNGDDQQAQSLVGGGETWACVYDNCLIIASVSRALPVCRELLLYIERD